MPLLNFKSFSSSGPPVLILHGLFGSLENWSTQAQALGNEFTTIAADLRNHGRSPHWPSMRYANMANDVVALMDHIGVDNAHVIGHSMGGKTAMQLALNYPSRVKQLVIVDIAPRRYPVHHSEIFTALGSLNLTTLKSRNEADLQISPVVPEVAIRSFLLKNLQRTESGFTWKMNLPVLRDDYDSIADSVTSLSSFDGKTLFIKGGDSDYIGLDDQTEIERLFPSARTKIIQNAGHWPHVEKAEVFTRIVRDFLTTD